MAIGELGLNTITANYCTTHGYIPYWPCPACPQPNYTTWGQYAGGYLQIIEEKMKYVYLVCGVEVEGGVLHVIENSFKTDTQAEEVCAKLNLNQGMKWRVIKVVLPQ